VNRLRRVTGGSLAVVCALLALLPASASAATSDPLSWSQPTLIAGGPPFRSTNALQAVSCPSTSLCVAVDNVGGADATTDATAATPTWGPHEPMDATRTLNSISCVAGTTTCAAVDKSGYVIVTADAGSSDPTWSRPDLIDSGNGLNSISCASTSLCAATDNDGNAFTSTDPFASSPTWHEQTGVDSPYNLNSVSCVTTGPTTGYCVAVTSGGYAVITDDPADASPTWTPSAAAIAPADMTSVSCVSTTLCVAVDNLGTAVETNDPTDTSTPPLWSTAAPIDGTKTMFSISCTSAVCAAVDDEGNAVVSTNAGDGPASWIWTTTPQQLPTDGVLFGASCVSSAVCVVVGTSEVGPQTFFSTPPTATTPSWTGVVGDGFNDIGGVSCPAGAGFCATFDGSDRVEITDDPGAASPTWTPSAVLDSGSGGYLTAISCADAGLCVVVDSQNRELYSTNPTAATPTWSSPVALGDGASYIYSLDCPADNLCVATDSNNDALVSQDPNSSSTWTKVAAKPGALSCAGTSMCMIVDDSGVTGHGYVTVLTDLTAAKPTVTSDPNPIDTSSAPSAVSCPSTALCIVGDDSGNVLVTSDPEDASPMFSSPEPVDPNKDITALSCPSSSLCVAGDSNGLTAMSTNPADTSVGWSTAQVFGIFSSIDAISCASTGLCAAGDNFGNASIGLTPTYALTVATAGTGSGTVSGGGIACPGTCSKSFTAGQAVSLTAAPAPGSTFAGWSGGGCSGTGTCSVTVSAATTVTATFDKKSVPPPPKLVCTLKLKSTKVVLPPAKRKKHAKPVKNAGTFTATATCNQAVKGSVSGTVTEAASKKKPKHGKKTFKLSSVKVSLSAGRSSTVTIRLPSGALKALAAKASESVSLKLTASGSGSGGLASATASGKLR
jgi:hypothetical protein